MVIEEIKIGAYSYLTSISLTSPNSEDISFKISDETDQPLFVRLKFVFASDTKSSITISSVGDHQLDIIFQASGDGILHGKSFLRIGSYDLDSKPLYITYVLVKNGTSNLVTLNFYTIQYGEDIG